MTPKPIRPTRRELAILRVLWERGPLTVRQLTAALNEEKPTGYTTALKMLQVMHEKNLVTRDESQRPQVYRARYSQEQTQTHLVGDLVQRAFDGSVKAMVMHALAGRPSSPEELEELEKLIDRIERRKK